MSPAEVGALKAVEAGNVVRIYRSNGNVLRGGGTSSATLWRLDKAKLIQDGLETVGVIERICRQILTPAGRKALAESR